ncbi:FadR/GntR family transcriptional regulator [Jannaschia sp. CCS1]|uniref:FadR/GntR family transcriptional regulator n=1 Tax=Jannaschia sp. (strain CCS1) TaxID=290400 RepID=UPI000053DC4F|nr:FCD domain-containing protein [Jannaschia sp. CCS1]ABD56468.1 transcriptional regulator, GntR family [Jannaschia sp. CCS1]
MTSLDKSLSDPVSANPVDALSLLPARSSSRDVLEALSLMIETQGLKVGDRLPPEVEIAKHLGIGRAKVREALTGWQNMGIVTRNKKAGTVLATEVSSNAIQLPVTVKLEAESLLRTHAVRRPLEIETVRLAAQNCDVHHKRMIRARSAELMAVYEAGEDWRAADYRFHAALQDASGNPLFGQLIRQIQQGFNEVYEAPFGQAHLGQASIPMHQDIADAVVAGDADKAAALMDEILSMVEDEIRQVMQDMGARDV